MIGNFAEAGADLELVGISKRFPGFTAIQELDLLIPAGSFFALLGPSGCGKTTTLRLVAGLEEPTTGKILIGGEDITNMKSYRRPVNTVFQSYALFPHMTILENVAFGLRRRKIPNAIELATEVLKLVELEHAANRKPSQLSGGQQQRVALARAVVNRPALLLLDEPLGALDLKLRRQMQLELKSIQSEVGLTFVHVTHDQEEAMTMADTIAVMNKGRIEQMGSPSELYDLPQTVFVANFLGQSNLFTGKVVENNANSFTIDIAGKPVKVPTARAQRHSGSVTVGVRPEKLDMHLDKPNDSANLNIFGPGVITDVSYTGVSSTYFVDVPGIGNMVVFAQNLEESENFGSGQQVWLSWAVEHTFGLIDMPEDEGKYARDDDTTSLAALELAGLIEEIEEEL